MTDVPPTAGLQPHTGAAARAAVAFLEKFDGRYYDALRALSDAVLGMAQGEAEAILKDLERHLAAPMGTVQRLEQTLKSGGADAVTVHLLLQRERASSFLRLAERLSRRKRAADRIIDLANELDDEENFKSWDPNTTPR